MTNLVLGAVLITCGVVMPPHPSWQRFVTVASIMLAGGIFLLAGALGW